MSLARYLGTLVVLKEDVPADKRGKFVRKGTVLRAVKLVGKEHFNLNWCEGGIAASQVHYTKLKTGQNT